MAVDRQQVEEQEDQRSRLAVTVEVAEVVAVEVHLDHHKRLQGIDVEQRRGQCY